MKILTVLKSTLGIHAVSSIVWKWEECVKIHVVYLSMTVSHGRLWGVSSDQNGMPFLY